MTTRNRIGCSHGRAPTFLVTVALVAALPVACESTRSESTLPESTRGGKAAVSAPSLGVAASFRVLGGSTVTSTGASTILGDLGVAPGLAITGFPPGLVSGGAAHVGDTTAVQAQSDVTAAYVVLAGDACAHDLTGQDLGGLTLTQGVYCFTSEAQLTGKLVLDAQGDPSAVFVFQVGSTLTTGSNASVVFVNGGQDCRAFWEIGSSATLGTDTAFAGSLLALTSISLNTRASVSGSVLARNGAVTMDTNHVFAAACATGNDAGIDGAIAESGSDSGMDAGRDSTASSGGSSGSGSGSGSGSSTGSSSGSGSGSLDLDAEGADVCDAKPEVDTIDLDAEGADACDAKPEVVTVDVDACDGADGGE